MSNGSQVKSSEKSLAANKPRAVDRQRQLQQENERRSLETDMSGTYILLVWGDEKLYSVVPLTHNDWRGSGLSVEERAALRKDASVSFGGYNAIVAAKGSFTNLSSYAKTDSFKQKLCDPAFYDTSLDISLFRSSQPEEEVPSDNDLGVNNAAHADDNDDDVRKVVREVEEIEVRTSAVKRRLFLDNACSSQSTLPKKAKDKPRQSNECSYTGIATALEGVSMSLERLNQTLDRVDQRLDTNGAIQKNCTVVMKRMLTEIGALCEARAAVVVEPPDQEPQDGVYFTNNEGMVFNLLDIEATSLSLFGRKAARIVYTMEELTTRIMSPQKSTETVSGSRLEMTPKRKKLLKTAVAKKFGPGYNKWSVVRHAINCLGNDLKKYRAQRRGRQSSTAEGVAATATRSPATPTPSHS